MTVNKLRKECKKNLLNPKGIKVELVDRLNENDRDKGRMRLKTKSIKRIRDEVDEGPAMGKGGANSSCMSPLKKSKSDPQTPPQIKLEMNRTIIIRKPDRKGDDNDDIEPERSRSRGANDDDDDDYDDNNDDDDKDRKNETDSSIKEDPQDTTGNSYSKIKDNVDTNNSHNRDKTIAGEGKGRVKGEETAHGGGEAVSRSILEDLIQGVFTQKIFKGGGPWKYHEKFKGKIRSLKGGSTENKGFGAKRGPRKDKI